jgi:anti-sigma factor RsiW
MNVISGQRSCARIQPLLDCYVSNELLAETNSEIVRHLESCTVCGTASEQRLRAKEVLRRSVESIEVDAALRTRIRGKLVEPSAVVSMPRPAPRARLAVAAAAAFCLFSGLGIYWTERHHAQTGALLGVGWINHRNCTLAGHYPDEIPTQEAMVTKLGPDYRELLTVANQRLGDFRIRQGHRCSHSGRQYAHLILQRGVVLASVAVLKKAGTERMPWRLHPDAAVTGVKEGISIAVYDAGQHMVFVMSNLPDRENERLADGVAPPLRSMLQDF